MNELALVPNGFGVRVGNVKGLAGDVGSLAWLVRGRRSGGEGGDAEGAEEMG